MIKVEIDPQPGGIWDKHMLERLSWIDFSDGNEIHVRKDGQARAVCGCGAGRIWTSDSRRWGKANAYGLYLKGIFNTDWPLFSPHDCWINQEGFWYRSANSDLILFAPVPSLTSHEILAAVEAVETAGGFDCQSGRGAEGGET